MTSAVVVAALLASSPKAETPPDGHAVFAKAGQVMLGGARLPWLVLASGSVARSDESGRKASERFVLEWEPCGRRDARGYFSKAAARVLGAAVSVLCGGDPAASARVERNGSHLRHLWVGAGTYVRWEPRRARDAKGSTDAARSFKDDIMLEGKDHILVEIDPESGIVARTRLEQHWTRYPSDPRKDQPQSTVVGTAEFSDYKPVGTMRLPHRMHLRAGSDREDWTIERIEIVPLP